MHEEFLKEEALKAEDQQRHFAMFGSPSAAISGLISPKGKNSGRSPTKGEQLKSPEKIETVQENCENREKRQETKADRKKRKSEERGLKSGASTQNGSFQSDNTEGEKKVSEKGVIVSNSQTPCSSKDSESRVIAGEVNGNENVPHGFKPVGPSEKMENLVEERPSGENTEENNGAYVDIDSEDEVRHEDITVEERKARLKRTLSPSFFNEDLYRLKKKRVRNDSFMCESLLIVLEC